VYRLKRIDPPLLAVTCQALREYPTPVT